jgi:hypothetical protein
MYQTKIDQNIDSTSWPSTNNVEVDIEKFPNLITNTALDFFNFFSYSGKIPPVLWWNIAIQQAIQLIKSAFTSSLTSKE